MGILFSCTRNVSLKVQTKRIVFSDSGACILHCPPTKIKAPGKFKLSGSSFIDKTELKNPENSYVNVFGILQVYSN